MTLSDNEPCPHCGRYRNRGVSVDAVIVKDGNVLLIRRGAEPFKGQWALPGGYVEWDESAEDAVKREVKEEVGMVVDSLQQIKTYSNPDRHPHQVVTVAFAVTVTGDPVAGDDAHEYRWSNLKELPELAFDHQQILNDYQNNSL